MWAVKLLGIMLIAYAIVLVAVFAAQTSLLFPTRLVGPAPLSARAERLVIETDGGEQIHGVHLAPTVRAAVRPAAILGFAGNSWNAENAAEYLHDLFPQRDVVVFHYRGYRPSSGAPSAAALLSDAPLVFDRVAKIAGVERIVAVGLSIGSGVAAHLAGRREVAGLILVTPFDSLTAVAQNHYPWLPVGLLFRHPMSPAQDLRGTAVPTALIAAADDTLIPPRRTRALRPAIANLVFDRTIAGTGHNDIYQHPAFRQAVVEALAQIERAGR